MSLDRQSLLLVLAACIGACGTSSDGGNVETGGDAAVAPGSDASSGSSGGSEMNPGSSSGSSGSGTTSSSGGGSSSGSGSGSTSTSSSGSGSDAAASSSGSGSGSGSGSSTGSSSGSSSGSSTPLLITSAQGAFWQSGTITKTSSGTATITVNVNAPAQTWLGFGGAFNELGWKYLQMLSPSDQSRAIDLLFGSDAAHFNVGRIPIGASDYATSRYTEDEVTSGTDLGMTNFSIARDMQSLIPYVKAAQAANPDMIFWASPWTPPTWMKTTTGSVNGTSCALVGSTPFDGGCMVDDAQNLTAYAQYFVDWLQAYTQQGIPIRALAPQNEPNYATGYPSCLWPSPLYAKFVGQYLAPAFTTANIDTQIMLGTMSNSAAMTDPGVVSAVMADPVAKTKVQLLGYQWNMQGSVASAKSFNLPIWQTEHKAGNYPFAVSGENPPPVPNKGVSSDPAPNDYAYGLESWGLIRDWINAGVVSYSAWNMVLDTVGLGISTVGTWWQNALLTVDTTAKTLNVTPAYYVFRHVSQFVQPQAVVVAATGGDALAFKNPDGSVVVVMYNSSATPAATVLAVGGTKLQFTIPANGFATVKN